MRMILIPQKGGRSGVAAALAALSLVVAGCGGRSGAAGDGIRVVAGFYPLAEAAQRVGGDRAAVINLTPPGAEPHDLELTTRDLERINDAGLLLYLGRGFQPALEAAAGQRSGASIDLLEGLSLREGVERQEEEEEHAGEAQDPHVWLDPLLFAQIVTRIAAALEEIDPAGGEQFEANARVFGAELDRLHQEFSEGLKTCRSRLVVTSHAAFAYLTERYGLQQQPIAGVSPETEPNPRRFAELADLVRREGVTTIFTETLVSPRVAEALAREAGVTTAVLNPIEGLTEEELRSERNYGGVMRENLAALRRALGCE